MTLQRTPSSSWVPSDHSAPSSLSPSPSSGTPRNASFRWQRTHKHYAQLYIGYCQLSTVYCCTSGYGEYTQVSVSYALGIVVTVMLLVSVSYALGIVVTILSYVRICSECREKFTISEDVTTFLSISFEENILPAMLVCYITIRQTTNSLVLYFHAAEC